MSYRVAVAGATGYAGGELLRLLLMHPLVTIRVGDGRCQRRLAAGAASAASGAAGGPAGRRDESGNARRARRGVPRSTARRLGRGGGRAGPGDRGHRLRGRLPAGRPGRVAAVLRIRPRRYLALRAARATGSAGQAGRCAADRRAGVLSDDGYPGPPARHHPAAHCCRRGGRGGQRPFGRRSLVEDAPARFRTDGVGERVRRGWGAPARPELLQNFRVCGAPTPSVSFTPVLVPMSRGILATCTARLADPDLTQPDAYAAYADAYAAEPFVHVLAEDRGREPQSVLGSNAVHLQVAVDRGAGGWSPLPRWTI